MSDNPEAPRYMRAYFHTFTPTGVDAVDAILEAIAMAGKGFHHTGSWDEAEEYGECGYWTLIQQRANEAAAALAQQAATPTGDLTVPPPWPSADGNLCRPGKPVAAIYTGDKIRERDAMWAARVAAARQAATPAPAEPSAWLVTGGRTFADTPYMTKQAADGNAMQRGDGSHVVPLYAAAPATPAAQPADEVVRRLMGLADRYVYRHRLGDGADKAPDREALESAIRAALEGQG